MPNWIREGVEQQRSRGGRPLDAETKESLEGHTTSDLSRIQIHTGERATTLARALNAHAFTIGRDVFLRGEDSRLGTDDRRRLLAHEVDHAREPEEVLRRGILVDDEEFEPAMSDEIIPGETWAQSLANAHPEEGPKLYREILNAELYFEYSEPIELLMDIRQRIAARRALLTVEDRSSCCSYGSAGLLDPETREPNFFQLDVRHWGPAKPVPHDRNDPYDYSGKSASAAFLMRSDVKPSEAINSIFTVGADSRLECNTMMVAVQYKGILDAVGPEIFDRLFSDPNLPPIISYAEYLTTGADDHPFIEQFYERVLVTVAKGREHAELVPGDWVYFKNHEKYPTWTSVGAFRGENAMYVGDGKFAGFGLAEHGDSGSKKEFTYDQVLEKLLDAARAAHGDAKLGDSPPQIEEIPGMDVGGDGTGTAKRLNMAKLRAADPKRQ